MEQIINSYYEDNAQKLHNLVDKILVKLQFFEVDNEDFYSLANEIFADSLNRYDGRQEFEKFLYFQLLNKFKTEMTKRNRYKRQADKMAISIDTPIGEDENLTIGFKMQQYLNQLSSLQEEVLRLISIGYTPSEIIGELHINKKQYDDCYRAIHSYRNISILL